MVLYGVLEFNVLLDTS